MRNFLFVSICMVFDLHISLHTPGIRLHGTGVGTKNVGVDKKSTNRVGICKRSFLRHIHHFSAVILDRVYYISNQTEQFDVKIFNEELVARRT
jgi:hypothetical protein